MVFNQTEKEFDISKILNEIRKKVVSNHQKVLADDVKEKISEIKDLCNNKYADETFFGGSDALNRKILHDPEIAERLTPDVIIAIFNLHSDLKHLDESSEIVINRSNNISLAAVLYFGFENGQDTVKFAPSVAEIDRGPPVPVPFDQQVESFEKNTQKIISNVLEAAKNVGIPESDLPTIKKSPGNLIQRFEVIENITKEIMNEAEPEKFFKLLQHHMYTPKKLEDLLIRDFQLVCQEAGFNPGITKDGTFVIDRGDRCANLTKAAKGFNYVIAPQNNKNKIRDPFLIIHHFYNRTFLETALISDVTIQTGPATSRAKPTTYKFRDVLKAMVKVSEDPDYEIGNKRMVALVSLIENHLKEDFPDLWQKYGLQSELNDADTLENLQTSPPTFAYTNIKNLIEEISHQLAKKEMLFEPTGDLVAQINFLKNIIDQYDKANGGLSIHAAMLESKNNAPDIYQKILNNEQWGRQIILTTLLDDSHIALMQGPFEKNLATIELERLLHAILNDDLSKGKLNLNSSYNILGELEVNIDGKNFNITQILLHQPNLGHLNLTDDQLESYVNFIWRKSLNTPSIPSMDTSGRLKRSNQPPSNMFYESKDILGEASNLNYAEKLALTLYTGDTLCTPIQNFLRQNGQSLTNYPQDELSTYVTELLLSACVASHGLARPLAKEITNLANLSYRREHVSSEKQNEPFFKSRVTATTTKKTEQKIVTERAFTSASQAREFIAKESAKKFKEDEPSNVVTLFHGETASLNPIGKSTRTLSQFRHEKEITYPPGTQFYYVVHETSDGEYFFSVRPVRSLDGTIPHYTNSTRLGHEVEILSAMLNTKNLPDSIDFKNINAALKGINIKEDTVLDKDNVMTYMQLFLELQSKMNVALANNQDNPEIKDLLQASLKRINEHCLGILNEHIEKFIAPFKEDIASPQIPVAEDPLLNELISFCEQATREELAVLKEKLEKNPLSEQTKQAVRKKIFFIENENVIKHAEYVYEKHLSKSYAEPHICDYDLELNVGDDKVIPRPNHGLAHTLRVVFMVRPVIDYFKKYSSSEEFKQFCANLSEGEIDKIQIALLFFVAGRESEVRWKESLESVKKYKAAGFSYFQQYAEHALKMPNQTIEKFEGMKGDSKYFNAIGVKEEESIDQFLFNIMFSAHNLDLLRCFDDDEFSSACLQGLQKLSISSDDRQKATNRLIKSAEEAISATGDRLVTTIDLDIGKLENTGKRYTNHLFYEASTKPERCLKLVSSAFAKTTDPHPEPSSKEDVKLCLFKAVENGLSETTKFLLHSCSTQDKVELLKETDEKGKTLLILAAERDYIDIFNLLIANGADVDQKDKSNESALDKVVDYPSKDRYEEIIHYAKNKKMDTPLSSAIQKNQIELAEYLIKNARHSITIPDKNGNTPLIIAVENSCHRLISLLIECGADLHAKNNKGESAMSMAPNLCQCIKTIKEAEKSLSNIGKETGFFQLDFKTQYESAMKYDENYFYDQYVPAVLDKHHNTINDKMFNQFVQLEVVLNTKNPDSLIKLANYHLKINHETAKELYEKARAICQQHPDKFSQEIKETEEKLNGIAALKSPM